MLVSFFMIIYVMLNPPILYVPLLSEQYSYTIEKIHRLTSEFHVNPSKKLRKQTDMADMGTYREISTNVLPWEEGKVIEVLLPKRPCSKGKSADFVNGNASFQVPRNVQLIKQTDIVGA